VSTDPSTDPDAADELPHTDLARDEAEELLTSVFPSALEEQAGVYADLEVQAFRSDHVAVVPPADPTKDPGLLSSLLPLRTEAEDGSKEVVNLDLEDGGATLQPANPLVDLEIPATLDQPINLPEVGVRIGLDAAAERSASIVSDGAAFYPNVAEESDFTVVAIPTGVETLTQLRSAEAPTTQTYTLDLPAGADLEGTDDGGAIVKDNGDPLLVVRAPSAIDAEGNPVPVSMEVEGSTLSLKTSPASDAAFPILVDPIFETYSWKDTNTKTGIYSDWRSYSTPNQSLFMPGWIGNINGTLYSGLSLRSSAGAIAPGTSMNWNYYVPRYFTDKENPAVNERPSSFIRNIQLSQLYFSFEDSPAHRDPYIMIGLWDENKGEFASYGQRTGWDGPYNGVSVGLPNPGEYTTVKNGGIALATFELSSYPRQAFVGSATVEVTDQDTPEFGELFSVPGWVSALPGPAISYKATDRGLGIQQFRLRFGAAAGGKGESITSVGCTGAASSACPQTTTTATKAIAYNPAQIQQGENWTTVYAVDPIGHWSPVGESRIRVDREAPELSLTGPLTEQGTLGNKLTQYGLSINAKDGDEAVASATSPAGTVGTGTGQLERPFGVDADEAGNIWISDTTNSRVVEFDKNGKYVQQISSAGGLPFKEIRGLSVAPNGSIFIAEKGNHRVVKLDANGQFVWAFATGSEVNPFDVAVTKDGIVWMTDPDGKKVYRYKENGTKEGTISITQPYGGVALPFGIDVDEFGNGWVAIQGTNQILELSPSGSQISSFGSEGTGNGQLKAPFDVSIAPSGNIFVSDAGNNRIQEFKPDGGYMRQFGTTGTASNQLDNPKNIAVAPGNRILVADYNNKRIARWDHADRHVESGAVKTEVKVDNILKDTYAPGCAEKNCSISREWVMKADDYSVGAHKVDVISTDGVGLPTTKTITVETHGDRTAPTIALSGSITEQATLGKTLPTYKVKASATDPGPAEERKSGVASLTIMIDGKSVDSVSPGCPAEGCSLTREWTLNSSSYAAGWHWLEVVATDAAGKSKTTFREFEIKRDTIAPELVLSGTLPGAPEGWVQQEVRNATADATDQGGYGVKQIRFSIDGTVVGESATQACATGGCPQSKLFSINMATYDGGAHQAVMAAEDGAGNVRKKTWTINVDPSGNISQSEAEDTLEALDATSPVNTVGGAKGEVSYEGTSENLSLESQGSDLEAVGSAAPTTIPTADPGGLTVEVPGNQAYAQCPNRPAEEEVKERTGAEEEALALSATCGGVAPGGTEPSLVPISVTPVNNIGGGTQEVTPNGAAVVAQNVAPHVDLVTRPLYDGGMIFSAIRDAAGPETFSWRVNLDVDQQLVQIDTTTAKVKYLTGQTAFSILAVPAHDAIGTTVPTRIDVSGDVLTLTVGHRSGSYVYPVVGGAGWEGGFQTYQIVMPSGEEAGELSEDDLIEDGEYRLVEGTVGPPEALAAADFQPSAASSSSDPKRKRRYNFHDCRFDVNGYNGEVPGDGLKREGIKKCHGEEQGPQGGYYTLHWAVSVHGTYFYKPHQFVWLNARPECNKWGPSPPAKVNCKGGPDLLKTPSYPNIDVIGDYRFAPGTWGGSYAPFDAVCYRISGRLPNYWVDPEPGHPVLMTTFHVYRRQTDKDDKCDFDHLDKVQ
jgi:streptogramin lyase